MSDKELFTTEQLRAAHLFCGNHKPELEKDEKCGCFFCLEIFHPSEIEEWLTCDRRGTAICPYCGIDSVIGESSGYPITKDFLEAMAELEEQQEKLKTTAGRYSEVRLWLNTFEERIKSGAIMNADDGMVMKALVEQIIVGNDGIEVQFKCGVSIEQEYVK